MASPSEWLPRRCKERVSAFSCHSGRTSEWSILEIVNQVREEIEKRVLLRRQLTLAFRHEGFDNGESAFVLLPRFRSRSSIVVLIASSPPARIPAQRVKRAGLSGNGVSREETARIASYSGVDP
jgi:hypothetical protein